MLSVSAAARCLHTPSSCITSRRTPMAHWVTPERLKDASRVLQGLGLVLARSAADR